MVVPVLAGGGMRVRILEAFARQMAVVTTTIGLEGIEAKDNQDVHIGNTPAQFAAAVINLLTNPQLLTLTAASGRRLVERKYDWQVVFHLLDRVYRDDNKIVEPNEMEFSFETSDDAQI